METFTTRDRQRDLLAQRRGIPRLAPSSGSSRATATAGKVNVEQVLSEVRDLPALPTIVVKIMRMTGKNDSATPRSLAEVISHDPSFTARLMKMANSSYYGLPRSVSTISDAVMMLGNMTIRNMALVAATQDTMKHCVPGYELKPGEMWRHSVGCAFAVNLLAEQAHYQETEEAFVAGLLHDVGKLILGPYVAERLPAIQVHMEAEGCSFVEAEKAILGCDHAELGGHMALAWNLPALLAQAIRWHHSPAQNGYIAPMTALVYLGNIICVAAGASSQENELHKSIHPGCLHVLNLTEAHIVSTIEKLGEYVASLPNTFNE